MKTWYSKIFAACLFLLIPYQLFNELLVYRSNAPIAAEDFNFYYFIFIGLLPAYFKGGLAIVFCIYAKKKFLPKVELGINFSNLAKTFVIALIVFSVSKLLPLISSDKSLATYMLEPIIPGLRNWYIVTFMTVGVIEAFRYRLSSIKLAVVFLIFYSIFLYVGKFDLNLLPDPKSYGDLPLLSSPANIFHWSYILPSTIVIYSAIIYTRLGLVPSLFFTFVVGLMGMIYSVFIPEILVDNSILNNYLACIAVSTLLIKYLKKSTSLNENINARYSRLENSTKNYEISIESLDE